MGKYVQINVLTTILVRDFTSFPSLFPSLFFKNQEKINGTHSIKNLADRRLTFLFLDHKRWHSCQYMYIARSMRKRTNQELSIHFPFFLAWSWREFARKIKWKFSTFVLNQDSLTFTHKISYFVITLIHNNKTERTNFRGLGMQIKIVLKKTTL